MDAEESGKFMEKGELSCVGKSKESKMGARSKVKHHLSIWVERGEKWTHLQGVLAVQCKQLVSPITWSLERHIRWFSMWEA